MWILRNNETTVSVEKHWWRRWLSDQRRSNNSNARQTVLSLSHSYSYLNSVKSWKQYCGTERRPMAVPAGSANNLTANSPDFWKREISPLVFPVNIQIKMISFVMSFSLRPDFAMFKLFWKSAWFIQTTYWINTQILTILDLVYLECRHYLWFGSPAPNSLCFWHLSNIIGINLNISDFWKVWRI